MRRGNKVFGPYFALFTRENGRLRKHYVRREDVDQVLEAMAKVDQAKDRFHCLCELSLNVGREAQDATRVAEAFIRSVQK